MYITTKYILIEEIVLQILKKSSHLPHITLLYLYNKKTILGIKVSNINIAYSVSSIQKTLQVQCYSERKRAYRCSINNEHKCIATEFIRRRHYLHLLLVYILVMGVKWRDLQLFNTRKYRHRTKNVSVLDLTLYVACM